MDETFEIPVLYKGKELLFPSEVIRYGYVHRIRVHVDDQVVYLEKDEEGNYRAVADAANSKELDRDLILSIVSRVEEILK